MSILLRWRQPPPILELRWRGPTGLMLAAVERNLVTPIATVIGPPGVPGPKGDDGIVANPDDILDFIAIFEGSLT